MPAGKRDPAELLLQEVDVSRNSVPPDAHHLGKTQGSYVGCWGGPGSRVLPATTVRAGGRGAGSW